MIPFLSLTRQYAGIANDVEQAVLATLRSGHYVLGEPVENFETDFAAYCGTDHAVAVNSGTSALQLALLAAGVGPGDEVITVANTFIATVAAIVETGARPVLIDVDPVTLNMDPAAIAQAITPRTKVVMPVHLHGRLADMEAILTVARSHGLMVVEDAAQAHGARRGKRAGAFGDLGCFSFYPGKNLGAAGEGGAVVTDDPELARKVRQLRDWGQSERYLHQIKGYNFRMDAIQGAVLGIKLPHLDHWNASRRRVANAYDKGLPPSLARATGPFGEDHACHVYAILPEDRDAFRAGLAEAGVATNSHYPRPVHLQPAFAYLGYSPGSLPVTEAYAQRTLSLPMFPELTPEETAQVIDAVTALVEKTDATRTIKEEFAI